MVDQEKVETLVASLRSFRCSCRIKALYDKEPSRWGRPPILPVRGYLEVTVYGPLLFRDIEWIEIDPVVHEHVGVRVPDRIIDYTDELKQVLTDASIKHELQDGHYRVTLD